MESVGNSTIQILDASSSTTTPGYYTNIFDGTPQDTDKYGTAHIICSSNKSGLINAMHSIDREIWDIVDTIPYPSSYSGKDFSIGDAMYIDVPTKAKWYKTQFVNVSDTSCSLRLQTLLHPDAQPVSDPMNINLVQQDVSFINVTGSVGITGSVPIDISSSKIVMDTSPIAKVWESDEIVHITTVERRPIKLYTFHAMNFAPDYRFIKLYDKLEPLTTCDKPRMTIPLVADVPQNMQFPNGLLFDNCLKVKVTRCLNWRDNNFAEGGDVHVMITYDNV
jgi:hypothetical protein